jgi:hypothetical protein
LDDGEQQRLPQLLVGVDELVAVVEHPAHGDQSVDVVDAPAPMLTSSRLASVVVSVPTAVGIRSGSLNAL